MTRSAAPPDAQIEHALTKSYLLAPDDSQKSAELLDAAEQLLDDHAVDDHACFFARLVDQRAYRLNKPRAGEGKPDHAAALAQYRRIPPDGPPFARCRRHNGVGWSLLRLGRVDEAREQARSGLRVAGDSGSLRLRAMALNLLRQCLQEDDPRAAAEAGRRAADIARRLQDEELLGRYG